VHGVGPNGIAKKLMELGLLTGAGNKLWWPSTISRILENEKYMGDMLQQKTVSIDYLNHTRKKNNDHSPTYYTEKSHEAIIDKETFELAQRIRKNNSRNRIGKDKNLAKFTNRYPLSAMIICNECGRTLKRRYWNYGKPSQRVMQQCGNYLKGKANCQAKASYQDVIEGTTIQMLNDVFLKDLNGMKTIKSVIQSTVHIDDIKSKINILEEHMQEKEIMLSNLIDTRVKTPHMDESLFNLKYREHSTGIKEQSIEISKLEIKHIETYETKGRIDKINELLQDKNLKIKELNTEVLRSFIYKIISISPSEIV